MVDITFTIKHQSFLHQLQLMDKKHQYDADYQGHKSGIKGHTKVRGNAGNITFNGTMCLPEGIANTTNRTDKPDGGYSPGQVTNNG